MEDDKKVEEETEEEGTETPAPEGDMAEGDSMPMPAAEDEEKPADEMAEGVEETPAA